MRSSNKSGGVKLEMKKNIEDAQVNILLTIDGEVHLISMQQQNLEAVDTLVKVAAETAYPTGKSQNDLRKFLGLGGNKDEENALF